MTEKNIPTTSYYQALEENLDKVRRGPGTCKTCKWWGEKGDIPTHGLCCSKHGFIACHAVPAQIAHSYSADSIVTVSVGGSGIYTGPDFGCIHHEEKT